jgi:hypothetical protein
MAEAPKGLVTVAFLKTKLDEGVDHLGLFEPLILDALGHVATPDFLADDIKAIVHDRTGLLLPTNAIQTLLGRCARRGFVKREGGRFFRTTKTIPDPGFDRARQRIEVEQDSLGRALVRFAANHGVSLDSPKAALEALATFISDNNVSVILNEPLPDSPLERSSLGRKLTRAVARFITVECLASPELRRALAGLTEGILLQDILFMRDIPDAARRFRDLLVALDTPILFAAIDLMGVANAAAAKEGLALLREAGARTITFRRTLEEMRRILTVYEERLGSTEGRLGLYPTALTQHVLTARLSPADIRLISSTLENRLAKVGVVIREVPAHDRRYTLDEEALASALVDVRRPDPDEPRIRHDVDCVAAVLTLRAGRVPTSVEDSVAIFVTTSGRVVRNIQQWFFDQGEHGVPPIIHQAALTSIAWLKRPAAAPSLKIHELAAVCVAALRPTRETMAKFIETLRRLRADGTITGDETAAIVASELMEPLLARLDDEFEPDSDSIQAAIERVRETYRLEAARQAEEAIAIARREAAELQQAAEDAIRTARAAAGEAQRLAAEALAARSQVIARVEARVQVLSKWASDALFWLGAAVVVAAAVLSLPGIFDAVGGVAKWVARGVFVVAAGLGVYSMVQGASLRDVRNEVQDRVAARIRCLWLPAEITSPTDGQTSADAMPPAPRARDRTDAV